MTTDLEASLSARLRALRVDPPDDGFADRLAARLEQAPTPVHIRRTGVVRLLGKKRGILLLSAAAVFVSGAAFAFLRVAPFSFNRPSAPAAVSANAAEVPAAHTPPSRPRPHRVEPMPLAVPPPEPKPPETEATPRVVPQRLPSPIERSRERAPSVAGHAERPAPAHAEALPAEAMRADVGPRELEPRSVPELPSPLLEREERSRAESGQRPHAIPRLNADIERPAVPHERRERPARPGLQERTRQHQSGDQERRREVERMRERTRLQRPDNQSRDRERRRPE